MKYTVEITSQAESDLRDIYAYIAFDLLAPVNAAGQLGRLEEAVMGLASLPFRFRQYAAEPWKSRGLRIMPVDHYVVLYIPNEEKAVVTVIRVMYGGRDIEKQLNKYTAFQ